MTPSECPDCRGKLVHDQDEIYCRECGLVVDDTPITTGLDGEPNWNEKSSKPKRYGKPNTYIDGSMNVLPPTRYDYKGVKRKP